MISATTKIYGIVGRPLGHSLSPLLQNSLARATDTDMIYVAFHVSENIETAINGAFELGISGFNVTVPFKTDMLKLIEKIEKKAKKIGAVNTLVRGETGYIGYNTDITGLEMSLGNNGMSVKNKNVILLGAGGAAKSALCLAIENQAKTVTVINRNIKKAEKLKEEFSRIYTAIEVLSLDAVKKNIGLLKYDDYFVFQTTSVGMYPNVNDCIIENSKFYKKCDAGIDLIYTPFETVFIKNMQDQGRKCINGLDMLILQGVASFELWNGIKVNREIIENIKKMLLKDLREKMK